MYTDWTTQRTRRTSKGSKRTCLPGFARLPIAVLAAWLGLATTGWTAPQDFADQLKVGTATTFSSKILDEDRPLLVCLPEGYEGSQARFPVLYMLDGESHFHHATGVVRFLARSSIIPEMIVIAIPNTDRGRDFWRTHPDGRRKEEGPQNFRGFLKDELVPFVERTYRTLPYRVLWGHSATASFVCNSLVNDPGLFEAYIAASPSEGWDGDALRLSEDSDAERPAARRSLHVSYGDRERERFIRTGEAIRAALERSAPPWLHWRVAAFENDNHGSTPHKSLYQGLEHIFFDARPPSHAELVEGGIAVITAHHETTKRAYGITIGIPDSALGPAGMEVLRQGRVDDAVAMLEENARLNPSSWRAHNGLGEAYLRRGDTEPACESLSRAAALGPLDADYEAVLNWLGYDFLRGGDKPSAVAVFGVAVAAYPDSANAHDSLGEALAANGDIELAIESYEKSLELDPENQNAGEMLRRLRDD